MKTNFKLLCVVIVFSTLSNTFSVAQSRNDAFVKESQQKIETLTDEGKTSEAIYLSLEAGRKAYELGMIKTATWFYSTAESMAADNGLKDILLEVYKSEVDYYESRAAYKAANIYLRSYYELRDQLNAEAARIAEAEELEAQIAAEEAEAAAEAAQPDPFIIYYVIIGAMALLYVVAAIISSVKRRQIRRQIVELEKGYEVNAAAPMEMALKAERIRSTAADMVHNCRKEGFDFRTEVIPLLSLSRSLSLTASNIVACSEENYKPEIKEVDMDKILKRASKEFEPKARMKGVKVDYKSTGKAIVEADEHLIGLAIDNLVDNAVKYSSSNKTVSLWIETVEKKTIIGIENSGTGLDSAKIKAMLQGEAFETTESPEGEKGLGLGVTVCRKAAESSHAAFEIVSSQEGTTAKFIFK